MGQQTTTISPVSFYRQPEKPPSAADGAVWATASDGVGDDTASRYVYNAEADAWELDSAVGPSEPNAGVPVAGATWRNTSSGSATQYDGNAFVSLGVTDHALLDNVTRDQHHSIPRVEFTSIGKSDSTTVPGPGTATLTLSYQYPGVAVDAVDVTADAVAVTGQVNELRVNDIAGNTLKTVTDGGTQVSKRFSFDPTRFGSVEADFENTDDTNNNDIDVSLSVTPVIRVPRL